MNAPGSTSGFAALGLPRVVRVVLVLLVAAGTGACRLGDEFQPPPFSLVSDRYFGTPLTGPRPVPEGFELDPEAEGLLVLHGRVHWFESMPEHGLPPIIEQVDRIVSMEDASRVVPAPMLATAAFGAVVDDAVERFDELVAEGPRSVELGAARRVLPRGVTMRLRSAEVVTEPRVGAYAMALQAANHVAGSPEADGHEGLRVAFTLDGYLLAAEGELVPRREVVLLRDAPRPGGPGMLLVLQPRDQEAGTEGVFALVLTVSLPPPVSAPPEERQAFELDLVRCSQEIREGGDLAMHGPGPDPLSDMQLLPQGRQRAALYRLALVGGAPLASDFAMAADEIFVRRFLIWLNEQRDDVGPADVANATMGLSLEVATYRFLATVSTEPEFSAGLRSLLLRHAGEVGQYPLLLEDLLRGLEDQRQLEQRLVAQNLEFLGDRSASARTRAYEWLGARGRAPEGYEPMAPKEQREKALASLAEAEPESP